MKPIRVTPKITPNPNPKSNPSAQAAGILFQPLSLGMQPKPPQLIGALNRVLKPWVFAKPPSSLISRYILHFHHDINACIFNIRPTHKGQLGKLQRTSSKVFIFWRRTLMSLDMSPVCTVLREWGSVGEGMNGDSCLQ